MDENKISIITVTYNSASTLHSTLDSIKSQSVFDSIEYIIVDGNSNDGTQAIIKANENIVSNWISEADSGIYDAMNKGLKLATGDWVGYLHADDVFADNYTVESIIKAIKNNSCNVIYGNLNYVKSDDLSKTVRHWRSNPFKPSLLKKGWMPPHPTLYVKRELFEKLNGFNTSYSIAADYDFTLRLFSEADTRPYFLDKLIVKMRMGGASNKSISNIIQKSKEDYRALKANEIGGLYSLFIKNASKLTQFLKSN